MKDKDNNKYFPLIFLLFTALNSIFWITCGIRDLNDKDLDENHEYILHNLSQGEIGYILSTIWVIISIINNNLEDCCQSFKKFFFLFIELVCFVFFYIICDKDSIRKILYPCLIIATNLALFLPIFVNNNETESFPCILSFLGLIYYLMLFIQLIKYKKNYYEGMKTSKYIGTIGGFTINFIIIVFYFIMVCKRNEFQKILNNSQKKSVRNISDNNINNNNYNNNISNKQDNLIENVNK
jgi:hypothetical protein